MQYNALPAGICLLQLHGGNADDSTGKRALGECNGHCRMAVRIDKDGDLGVMDPESTTTNELL